MADQDAQKQQQLKDKVRESEAAVEYDRQCKSQDFNSFVKKFNYLKQFRDDNKHVSLVFFFLSLSLSLFSGLSVKKEGKNNN